MKSRSEATITDLYQIPENAKAEIVNGEVVLMSPTGGIPGRAGGKIYRSLDDYEQQMGNGYAFPDNVQDLRGGRANRTFDWNKWPDSPAAAWYAMIFFTKFLHVVQKFREKDGLFRPAGGEVHLQVENCVSPGWLHGEPADP
jgi:hypothetical protein